MNNVLSKLLIASITVLLIALGGCGGGTAPKPDVLYFVHTDHLGTPVVITDSTQATVWQGDKAPFGETTAATVNQIEFNVRFPGQHYDQESGLHYNYFRDYDPATGRYVQSDPIGLRGGLNSYGYAYQNPLMFVDPSGEFSVAVPLILLGILGIVLIGPAIIPSQPTINPGSNVPSFPGMPTAYPGSESSGGLFCPPIGFGEDSGIEGLQNPIMNNDATEMPITINDDGSGAIEIEFEGKNGTVTIQAEPRWEGKTLILGGGNGAHVGGPGAGSSSIGEIRKGMESLGKKVGASEVIIEGGTRTTGANPGKRSILRFPIK